MASISLRNISKTYPGGITAVEDFSLDVADGELMVIVGPSGCGKTTTLRLIAGLETPDAGVIEIAGRSAVDVSPRDRNISMVFQQHSLYPHMTVRRNLAFALKMRGADSAEIKESVHAIAGRLGIQSFLNRKPHSLSGGQRQRVALARALVRDADAYLFDEPLGHLDPAVRKELRVLLKSFFSRRKATVIYVTHDQVEAMALGDRVCVMAEGRVQQIGSPLEVYRKPANLFVARFIGAPAMNFIRGRIATGRIGPCFVAGQHSLSIPDNVFARIRKYANVELILGIRPQDILIDKPQKGGFCVPAQVKSVEYLGDCADVYLEAGYLGDIAARVDGGEPISVGGSVKVCIKPEKSCFFETSKQGRNIAL